MILLPYEIREDILSYLHLAEMKYYCGVLNCEKLDETTINHIEIENNILSENISSVRCMLCKSMLVIEDTGMYCCGENCVFVCKRCDCIFMPCEKCSNNTHYREILNDECEGVGIDEFNSNPENSINTTGCIQFCRFVGSNDSYGIWDNEISSIRIPWKSLDSTLEMYCDKSKIQSVYSFIDKNKDKLQNGGDEISKKTLDEINEFLLIKLDDPCDMPVILSQILMNGQKDNFYIFPEKMDSEINKSIIDYINDEPCLLYYVADKYLYYWKFSDHDVSCEGDSYYWFCDRCERCYSYADL